MSGTPRQTVYVVTTHEYDDYSFDLFANRVDAERLCAENNSRAPGPSRWVVEERPLWLGAPTDAEIMESA